MALRFLEIDLEAIEDNVKAIKKIIGPSILLMAVVKSNAYGHGLVPVSKKAIAAGAKWLAVFSLEEALRLRTSGIKSPILILGFAEKEKLKEVVKNNLSLTLYDLKIAKEIAKLGGGKVHLKIDTGMHRLGILEEEVSKFIKEVKKLKNIKIEGVFSHFSESQNKEYSFWQVRRFKEALEKLKKEGIMPPLIHMANSEGTLTLPEARFNLVRCGLAIYGLSPFLPNSEPALSFKAKIIQVKDLKKGDYVGYQRTFQAKRAMKIAILGAGYADGYDRGLSDIGEVLVKGIRSKVLGRICMNQTITEVRSQKSEVRVGDTVTLIGKDGGDRITVGELAEKLGTIPHEVVARIPENVKRVYHE